MTSGAHVDRLGRRCKAIAKPKAAASTDGSLAEANPWESDEESVADAEPNPWADMHDVVRQLPTSAAHIDVENVVAPEANPWDDMDDVVLPPGNGVPCTSCQRHHAGPYTIYDILNADMLILGYYAEVFLPLGPELHKIRGDLYTLMGETYRVLKFEEPTVIAEQYGALRVVVMNLKVQCDVHFAACM